MIPRLSTGWQLRANILFLRVDDWLSGSHPAKNLPEESAGNSFDGSASAANAKRLVYLKLMEKHHNTDPFKFVIYSAKINEQTPQMAIK